MAVASRSTPAPARATAAAPSSLTRPRARSRSGRFPSGERYAGCPRPRPSTRASRRASTSSTPASGRELALQRDLDPGPAPVARERPLDPDLCSVAIDLQDPELVVEGRLLLEPPVHVGRLDARRAREPPRDCARKPGVARARDPLLAPAERVA